MKILQIHNLYQKHGGEDAVVEIERQLLQANGHTVLSLIADNKNINNIISARKSFYERLEKLIEENPDIDLAHIHNIFSIISPKIYNYLKKKKIPILQTIHNFRFLCPNGLFFDNNNHICELCKNGNFKNSVLKKCYHESYWLSFLMQYQVKRARNFALKNVTTFIALSNFTRDKLIDSGFVKERIVVKPNFLFPQPPQETYLHDNYALFIGRLSREKGVDILIDAFKTINFKLKIAGTGDIFEELVEKCRGFDNIEFIGFVSSDEKEAIISKASFIIVPSLQYENFPVSILDAFSRGKTVIASRIGSIPEIVIDNYSGLLFEMGNLIDLKLKIEIILKDNIFKEMGKNAYKEFSDKFQTLQNYNQLIDIYTNAIEGKN